MNEWRTKIRCYVSRAGNNRIADWYNGLSAQARSDADAFITLMRKTKDWKMPDYRPRLVDGQGLGELRWNSENKKYRLLGFFMGGYWYAVAGCTHKQQRYDPSNTLETAKSYKKQIENSEVRTVDYDI